MIVTAESAAEEEGKTRKADKGLDRGRDGHEEEEVEEEEEEEAARMVEAEVEGR